MEEVAKMDLDEVQTVFTKPVDLDPNMSDDDKWKLMQHRTKLINELNGMYHHYLIRFIKTLPVHVVQIQEAFSHLDTGIMWVEKGIMNINEVPNEAPKEEDECLKSDAETAETEAPDLEPCQSEKLEESANERAESLTDDARETD